MAEKNYTKFDNDYFGVLAALDLTGSEFKVLLFLLRMSACFKRDYTKECSATYIADGTGISDRQVKRILNELIKKKLIYLDVSHSGKKGNSYFISSDKLGKMKGQIWTHTGDKHDTATGPKMSHKEIREDNREQIREKEKVSPLSVYPYCSERMKEMEAEDIIRFLELLPVELRTKDPDEMTDKEWKLYNEWRWGNGLL